MRLLLRPAWQSANPYTALFADALVREGVDVSEMGYSLAAWTPFCNGVVLHWPDEFFNRRTYPKDIKTIALLSWLWLGRKLFGQKVVWVVHNVSPHELNGQPFLLARSWFLRSVDGLMFLSATSRDLLLNQRPDLGEVPYVISAHGHYLQAAATEPTRPHSILPHRPIHLAYVGQIRRYKGPDLLARAVCELAPRDVALEICGSCSDSALARELNGIASRSTNITVELGRLSDADLERHIDGADAVVLPYRNIVNSGSALLALSRFRPVIMPRQGSLIELQEQVGKDWVYLYEGELTSQVLRDSLQWLRETPRKNAPDLSTHNWDVIGTNMASFLRELTAAPRRREIAGTAARSHVGDTPSA